MPSRRKGTKRASIWSNQRDVEHTVDSFIRSLAGFQSDALPVNQLFQTTENLAYVARNSKGLDTMGDDPHWDRERVFEGHVRAPLDKKAKDLGFIWTEHIYNMNPLAGTGTENLDFLAGGAEQQLSEMNLLADIAKAQGNPIQNTSVNVMDPGADVQSLLANRERLARTMEEYRAARKTQEPAAEGTTGGGGNNQPGGRIVVDSGERLLSGGMEGFRTRVGDRNKLKSRGFMMVNDPAGRHPIFTHDGEPIQYYLDGSIKQAEKVEQDALDTEPLDQNVGPSEWLNWFGHDLPNIRQSVHPTVASSAASGDLDKIHENLMSNNYNQQYLTGSATDAADNYTMEGSDTKQMFLDYDRPFDPVPLLNWDGSSGHAIGVENNSKQFDMQRLG